MQGQWNPVVLTAIDHRPRRFAAIVLVLYCALTLFVALNHEAWRDEADSWLAARDLPLAEMIPFWTGNAGTPILWYLLLKPLALAGLPFFAQAALHLAIAWAAAAVLLWFAPLTRLTKVLVLASYPFFYEYAIVMRSYALTVLLVFAAAALHQKRAERPVLYAIVIALLFNTNVHGAIIAGTLMLLFALQPRRNAAALVIMAVAAVAVVVQLWPQSDSGYPNVVRYVRPQAALWAMASVFLPDHFADGWNPTLFVPDWTASLWIVLTILVLLFVPVAIRFRRDAVTVLLVPGLAFMAIFMFVWFGGARHSGLFALLVIAAIWIPGAVPRSKESVMAAIALNAALLASAAAGGIPMAMTDIRHPMSGSRVMAEHINAVSLERHPISCHILHACESILPYLDRKTFFYPATQREGSYMHWNRAEAGMDQLGLKIIVDRTRARFANEKRWYLVLSHHIPNPEDFGLKEVFDTGKPVRNYDEQFRLYIPLKTPPTPPR